MKVNIVLQAHLEMAVHTLVPTYTKPKYSTVTLTGPKWMEENAKKVRMERCLGRDLMLTILPTTVIEDYGSKYRHCPIHKYA